MFTGATAYTNAYFGQGNGPIFMNWVSCGSSDTALLACSYNPNTSEDNHGNDAGVRCGGEGSNTYPVTSYFFTWCPMYVTHFAHDIFCAQHILLE